MGKSDWGVKWWPIHPRVASSKLQTICNNNNKIDKRYRVTSGQQPQPCTVLRVLLNIKITIFFYILFKRSFVVNPYIIHLTSVLGSTCEVWCWGRAWRPGWRRRSGWPGRRRGSRNNSSGKWTNKARTISLPRYRVTIQTWPCVFGTLKKWLVQCTVV